MVGQGLNLEEDEVRGNSPGILLRLSSHLRRRGLHMGKHSPGHSEMVCLMQWTEPLSYEVNGSSGNHMKFCESRTKGAIVTDHGDFSLMFFNQSKEFKG